MACGTFQVVLQILSLKIDHKQASSFGMEMLRKGVLCFKIYSIYVLRRKNKIVKEISLLPPPRPVVQKVRKT